MLTIQANVFMGLANLEHLYLMSDQWIQLNNQSFNNLTSLSNLYLNATMLNEYKCILMHSIERPIQRSISNSYKFYKSLNILDSSVLSNVRRYCDLKLEFLQFKVHFNLKFDYENEFFYEECKTSLVKVENDFLNTLKQCFPSSDLVETRIQLETSTLSNKVLNVLSDLNTQMFGKAP